EAVRQIFQLPASAYECQKYNEHYKQVMGGNSLLVADGADHARKRRLLLPALNRRLLGQHGHNPAPPARKTIGPSAVEPPVSAPPIHSHARPQADLEDHTGFRGFRPGARDHSDLLTRDLPRFDFVGAVDQIWRTQAQVPRNDR